jgi:PPM family protein phosphatase
MNMAIREMARSASQSEAGRRPVNQDAVLIAALGDDRELVAVADGMGGHAAGEVASQRALEVLRAAVTQGDTLSAAVHAANAAVHQEAGAKVEREGMGTTLVALLRRGSSYELVNVGDSRAYRIDEAGVRQLTRDHSFVAEAAFSGQLSVEEAERSPWRNAVTRAIGTDALVEVDNFGPFEASTRHDVILCTDGVYRFVTADDLRRIVSAAAQPADAVRAIIDAALGAGSDDNLSVAIVRFAGASDIAAAEPAGPPATARRGATATPAARRTSGGQRRRQRRWQRGWVGRWGWIEAAIIGLGVLAVLAYVVVLGMMT